MKRTLIQEDSSSLIQGMLDRVNGLTSLDHKLTKGELRELFVSKILRHFLSIQFDVGTGIVINHRGDQSKQMDIVIYDNRILPPFIKEQAIGVYPAESVIAVLEIKSSLQKQELLAAEASASDLCDRVYDPAGFYRGYSPLSYIPLCGIIGFRGNGCKELASEGVGKAWLNKNIKRIFLICITGRYCWAKVGSQSPTWKMSEADKKTHEETKTFIAILLDNIRTFSETRYRQLDRHYDWLSIYLRDQKRIRDYFESI
ncbi:MAG: DUF6602 domain-containing protein [Thermodesulfovibrionales bacterium]|jgi:hypothetical protein